MVLFPVPHSASTACGTGILSLVTSRACRMSQFCGFSTYLLSMKFGHFNVSIVKLMPILDIEKEVRRTAAIVTVIQVVIKLTMVRKKRNWSLIPIVMYGPIFPYSYSKLVPQHIHSFAALRFVSIKLSMLSLAIATFQSPRVDFMYYGHYLCHILCVLCSTLDEANVYIR